MPYPAKRHLRYPRVRVWLKKTFGLNVNHKRVYRLMKELGIRARIRRRKPYFGRRDAGITSTNVLSRDFHVTAPNTKWVTDVTYLPIGSRFLYLSVIFDLYNNEVVAFRIGLYFEIIRTISIIITNIYCKTEGEEVADESSI
ncbi:IS3 family transposase [Paenibacillus lautus]|uniref:IS3 family transposase n=1 Tax=Paenibacillus lautus TaxID=1401 RepID=UPI003D2DEC13